MARTYHSGPNQSEYEPPHVVYDQLENSLPELLRFVFAGGCVFVDGHSSLDLHLIGVNEQCEIGCEGVKNKGKGDERERQRQRQRVARERKKESGQEGGHKDLPLAPFCCQSSYRPWSSPRQG